MEADVCTTGVDINSERKEVVDFTVPTDNTAPTIIAPSTTYLDEIQCIPLMVPSDIVPTLTHM